MALAKKTKKNVNGIIYLFENHVNGNLMEWSTGLLTFFLYNWFVDLTSKRKGNL